MKMSLPPYVPVVLDVGPAVHQNAGLSRYAERLAVSLLALEAGRENDAENDGIDLSLFYNRHSRHKLPESLAAAQTINIRMGQVPWRLRVLASQLMGRNFGPVEKRLPDNAIFHATEHLLPRLSCPTIMTVHDLIFERYPEHHTARNVFYLRTAMPRFVRDADAIIAVSKHTRDDLMDIYGTPEEKIHVIYEGIDESFCPASKADIERVRAEYSPDRPWLLMVGTLEPRKNHATAIRALRQLKQEGFPHRLLCVGGKGWLFSEVTALANSLGLNDDVSFAGYAPAEDLPALYSGADCALTPSLYEGFGFPVLEAMACGAPVVCSNSSSLPEVAGEAALLIPAEDVDALVNAIRLMLTQPDYAASMRERGIRRAAEFRWDKCAQETAALYQEVAAMRTSKEIQAEKEIRAEQEIQAEQEIETETE